MRASIRAAIGAADPTGFGARLGANLADESLRNVDGDFRSNQKVNRIVTVDEYTVIEVFVDETF